MAAITIGSRTRSVVARAIAPLAVVVAIGALIAVLFTEATRYKVPAVRTPAPRTHIDGTGGLETVLGNSRLYYAGTLPIIDGDGEPVASGSLEGYIVDDMLATRARGLADVAARSELARSWLAWLSARRSIPWAMRNLDEQLAGNERLFLASIATAIAQRTNDDRDDIYGDLVRSQFALDHGTVTAESLQAPSKWIARSLTAIKKTSSSTLLATQLAYPGLPDGGHAWRPLVRLVRPSIGYPYVELATPGLVGGVAGANREGLFVVLHVARIRARGREVGRPSTTLLRQVLQTAGSIDDAWRIVSGAEGTTALALVVYDTRSARIGLFERARGRSEWVKRAEGPVYGDGLIGSLRDDSDNDRGFRVFPVAARQQRMAALLADNFEDAKAFAQRLSDRAGVDKQPLPAGHRAAVYDPEAWLSVVFDPGSMMLWVAEDASRGRWHGIEVPTMRDAVVAAAAMPAAAHGFELPPVAEARLVRVALAAVRRARAMYPRHPAAARLVADQALRLAPKVPAVLETCLAVADRAQRDVADALLLRWELSRPDNLEALEQTRALVAHP
ncbi:MAG: hypothetical protein IPL79_05585 [Myxococcales bacterium]|nr:hypothetical protein [Myxococcales bacterium]